METATNPNSVSPRQADRQKSFLIAYEIMNSEEFTELADHREAFDIILSNGKATKDDLLIEINLEMILLTACEHKIMQIMKEFNFGDFNTEVLNILSNRINKMYIELFKSYTYDINLISNYLKFTSKNKKLTSEYKVVLDDIMDTYHSDPDVYIMGAHYAVNDLKDVKSAKQYIEIGKKFYEEYKRLYVEDFWIEVHDIKNTDPSIQMGLKKYNSVTKIFNNDINFHFDLVDTILDENITMTELNCIIIKDLIAKFRDNEFMWQKLAKIHLNGYVYNFDTEMLKKIQNIKQIDCIKNFVKIYNQALTETSSIKHQRKLWNLFLDDAIEIYNSSNKNNQTNKDLINKLIDRTFSQAFSTDIMKNPKHFIFWANRNHYDKDRELAVLKKGLTTSNENVDLWSGLFKYYINRDFLRNAMAVLFESANIIKVKSLPLWEIMELYVLSTEEEMIEKFYNQCSIIVKIKEINLRFRPEYLEWRVLTYDIENGRQLFRTLKTLEPKCLNLYKRMLQLETANIVSNGKRHIKYMRKLYSEACNKFGHLDVEIWNDCIQFEYIYGIPSLVDIIYKAGLNHLEKPSQKAELSEMKNELDAQFKSNEVIQIEDDE